MQNPNESFNSTIWERAQKTVYCGLDTLELAMYDAVANYNYGRKATLDIYEHLNMILGEFTSRMCNVLNVHRKYNAAHHNMPVTKKRGIPWRKEEKNGQKCFK